LDFAARRRSELTDSTESRRAGDRPRVRQLREKMRELAMVTRTQESAEFDVGARLPEIRQVHGLTQRQLAEKAGVPHGLISMIERNHNSPSVSSLRKILGGLPMTITEFFEPEGAGKGGVVISGELELTVGDEVRVFTAGDAFLFDSRVPHRFRNTSRKRAVAVSACTPPYL
jgi:transcriptional regulator with XRE-family HTH domain